ncbi:ATP-dependent RNA helicase [Starmerella bacillaris]|uniref:ATP-dependent RNA helicase FAL1 n=1 Tax=Starmerella bacillaris TaxID=1247836 RepID=A0AAV5RNK7_STABA|nr:ATP-dependent RNA helicase [Starmerella bacillaris]
MLSDLKDVELSTSDKVTVCQTFEEMKLDPKLLRGIYQYGFTTPSAIQARAITQIITGRDTIAQAQSGTGKTATFTIGMLQSIDPKSKDVQALVLSPTRELAVQIQQVIQALGDYMKVNVIACVGGRSVRDATKQISSGSTQIISGTPGRVKDMIKRHLMNLRKVRMLIMDEADSLLEQGFMKDITEIYKLLSPSTQVVIVSATMSPEVVELSRKFLTDPVKILVKKEKLSLKQLNQFYINVEEEKWKFDTLSDLYDTLTISQSVVFCNTRAKVDWLATNMRKSGFAVVSMHGDMMQKERDRVMDEFRSGKARVLISTDVWARGIDVQQVSVVINYDVPPNKENYLHRIGRSARFGRKGVAINLVTLEDKEEFKALQKFYAIKIKPMPASVSKYL